MSSNWYFWFPIYGLACGVNLLLIGFTSKGFSNQLALVVLWGGTALLVKVMVEDYVQGIAGLLSLDMHERVVREKLGSGLVIMSMLLHLKASHASEEAKKGEREVVSRLAESGSADGGGNRSGRRGMNRFSSWLLPLHVNQSSFTSSSYSKGGLRNRFGSHKIRSIVGGVFASGTIGVGRSSL
ncbi:hypothetical protein Cni_G29490 [Canna indica]|uniref:Uncharacterized protein n=1 Tax=Canna indica TaxID=4628 RepID=A0AAQ3QU25_9LILI|nr:hypothetical protein Cni_G29490 [Canna indica]